ncbi:MAG: hypothetical protein A4E35_01714 [Methanoregula sp. PtaU1.Bin051]|nr:MAG: hypothetical protein A4E35_01714 [Methanoregula sp. PtaU1.Bin051]
MLHSVKVIRMLPATRSRNRIVLPLLLALIAALLLAPASALDISTDSPPLSTPTISQGDPVFIHGTATGHPQQGLQIWLVGNNFVRITNVAVNNDNTFEYELRKADTQTMSSGQYFVLIQHPMMNGQFDIVYNAATGYVRNVQYGAVGGTGQDIFQLTGAGGLQSPAAASALMSAVASQNVDDMFTTVSFNIQPGSTLIDPIPDHAVGDLFEITGSTNLAPGDNLMVEITSNAFRPTKKSEPSGSYGAAGMVQVQKGSGSLNYWSFPVDASTFTPGEYTVTVSAVLQNVRGTANFRIVERLPATTVTTPPPQATTILTLPTMTETPSQTITRAPLPVLLIIAAPVLAFICRHCRGKV